MKYKELIDLGFKRIDSHDKVWFNEYGYDYFIVEYQLDKTHYIDWDVQRQTCQVCKIDKDANILETWPIEDMEMLKNIIRLFSNKYVKPKTINTTSFSHAA